MAKVDVSNMLGVLNAFSQQCEDALALGTHIKIKPPINAIVVCGMGGSALGAEILKSYLNDKLPFFIVRDYTIPVWANKNTLMFMVSYSGNTEEVLSCYAEARKRQCTVVCIVSDGKLRELATRDSVPVIDVPRGMMPRDSLGFQSIPVLNVLIGSGMLPPANELNSLVRIMKQDVREKAVQIAERIANKIPIIYSSEKMACYAKIWKAKINENAKVQAFANVFPELNHNEMVGFTNTLGDYYMIIIEDAEDHERVKKRMQITKEFMQERGIPVLLLKVTGQNRLARIFSTIMLGSFVGYYLAMEYNVDPTPITMVEDFKKKMRA
ncbi:MAG: bifunctional phosphoglucose/phosphomannose isomerase [Candidatus Woesearchaeota archaeon]|nr:bifunctional phosphoglucose/phosphomannose isomerase [Candidatus Woesearchaeota archaeon]